MNLMEKMRKRIKRLFSKKAEAVHEAAAKPDISKEDTEKMVQTASTGSPDLLLVYDHTPPMSVGSMPQGPM